MVSVNPSQTVHSKARGETLTKQGFTIADTTAACRGVLWEKDVGTLREEQSYKFTNVTIRTFNGVKYLSLSENAKIITVDDIGEVVDDDVEEGKVVKGEIIGVLTCDEYVSCRACKAKVLPISEIVGECSKCNMKAKLQKCDLNTVARIQIEDENSKTYTVTAFQTVIDMISKDQEGADLVEKLLRAPAMSFTVTNKDILSNVSV